MLTYTSTSPNSQHPSFGQIPSRQLGRQAGDKTSVVWMPDKRSGNNELSGGTRATAFGHEAAVVDRGIEIKPADVVNRRTAAWRGMRVEVIQCVTHDKVEFRFRAPWHLLLVYEEGVRDGGETIIGNTRSTLRALGRKLTFVPAGQEYHEWQQPSVRSRVICFYFDPAKLPVAGSSTQLSPRLFFENNMVWETAVRLAGAIEDGAEERYSEALGIVVAHELLRTNVRRRSPARGGLAAWQQRIATNFVEEHLADPVPLAALASLVNLSTYYFCRAFKQSFGVPPHRYHTLRRIERAKILLANPDQSITETALALGFSETSSFSAAFRHVTGTTPTAYRRAAG
jgi:AraC family transcriptional regulator